MSVVAQLIIVFIIVIIAIIYIIWRSYKQNNGCCDNKCSKCDLYKHCKNINKN